MKKDKNAPPQDPVKESRRYVESARKTLRENGKLNIEENRYEDPKYVRAAGHFLWHSALIMLDAVFQVKTMSHPHPDIVDYKNAVRLRDRKLLGLVTDGYITMHINMGYDGIQSKNACDDGFRLAEAIIERCAAMIPVVPAA